MEQESAIQHSFLELLEVQVDHWRDVEGDELRDHQPTHDDHPERPARGSVGPEADRNGSRADHRGEGRHQDGPEAIQTRIVNGALGRLAGCDPLAGKIDDHDSVLLDDPHQHEHPDERIERRLLPEQVKGQESPHEGCGKGREHRERVDVTLVENCQNHVHHEHGEGHQEGEVSDRVAKRLGLALQARSHGRRHDFPRGSADEIGGLTDGHPRLEIEEKRDAGELVQVVHRLRTERRLPRDQGVERHEVFPVIGLDVQERQVIGLRAGGVFHLQDDLVLVLGLLDQVKIVL